MRYILTNFAKYRLTNILNYINSEFGERVASKFSKKIERDIILLSHNPFLGSKETLLYFDGSETRSLIEGYYKILYYIDEKREIIYIVDFFDCRLDPTRMTDGIN